MGEGAAEGEGASHFDSEGNSRRMVTESLLVGNPKFNSDTYRRKFCPGIPLAVLPQECFCCYPCLVGNVVS